MQFVLTGSTYEELAAWRDVVVAEARKNPGLVAVNSNYEETKPQLEVLVDDDALRAGIVGRTEVHTLFSDLLPPPLPGSSRARGGSDVPASCLTRCWPGVPPGRMRAGACATTSTT